jgi:type II secretory pathway pseudopilin PulG
MHLRPRPRRLGENGSVLLEVVVALLVVVAVTTAFLLVSSGVADHAAVSESTARAVAAKAGTALAEASARGGDALLSVDPGASPGSRGRFWAAAGPAGFAPAGLPDPGLWTALAEGAQWGGARVATDPLGAPLAGWRPAGTVRCSPAASDVDRALGTDLACDLGGSSHVTYLVGHRDDPEAAAAVVLLPTARVRVFRWESGTGRWREGAR